MSATQLPILALDRISLSFGGVKAVNDISFAVKRGEIFSLIGPNGAGKSSILNVINGVYRANTGAVLFDGVRHARINPEQAARLGIARTFQNIALFKGMSVLDNILAGHYLQTRHGWLSQLLHLPAATYEQEAHRQRAEEIIDFLHLQPYRHTFVSRLPYGLQKRVELGRALASEPRLLLLDEPMAGMNLEEKQDMCAFILDVNREFRTTVVLIEHDLGVVMDISDHVVVLDYGRKIGDGTPDEVRSNEDVISAYLGVAH